jgi:hypothetical protein
VNTILNEIQELADTDLYALCEAIDLELQRREGLIGDLPDSARRRALERGESYRRRTGAAAPPVRAVGLHIKRQPGRRAA